VRPPISGEAGRCNAGWHAPRAEPPAGSAWSGAVSYLELATLPSAPFWARRQAEAALKAWQMVPEVIETAQLVVSELVTNAIKTVCPQVTQLADSNFGSVGIIGLTLRLLPGRIVVEVFDNDQAPPVLTDPDEECEDGRGLLLVQALSKEWGHFFPPAGGKTVYAVLQAESQTILRRADAEEVL
jgi:anti-sigma regulatory factor (Ser/Thr protein kinase)